MFSFYKNFNKKTRLKSEALRKKEEIFNTISFTNLTQIYCIILICERIIMIGINHSERDTLKNYGISISLFFGLALLSSVFKRKALREDSETFHKVNLRSKTEMKKAIISLLMPILIFEANCIELNAMDGITQKDYFWLSQEIMIFSFISLLTIHSRKLLIFTISSQFLYLFLRMDSLDGNTKAISMIFKVSICLVILRNLKLFAKLITNIKYKKYRDKKIGKKVLSLLPDGIVILDNDGIQYSNDSIYTILNSSKDKVLEDIYSIKNDETNKPENKERKSLKPSYSNLLTPEDNAKTMAKTANKTIKTEGGVKLSINAFLKLNLENKILNKCSSESKNNENASSENALKSDRTHYTNSRSQNKLLRKGSEKATPIKAIFEEGKNLSKVDIMLHTAIIKTKVNKLATDLYDEFKYRKPSTVLEAINYMLSKARTEFTSELLEKKSSITEKDKLSISGEQTYLMNSHRIDDKGNVHSYEIRFVSIIFRSKPAVCLIFRDVTERELRKKYEEKEKNTFRALASVSHEFRTPLNAIIAMLQSMKHKLSGSEIMKDNLLPAENSANLLLHLVNDILDIHQIQEHKLKIVPKTFNLRQSLEQTLNLFSIQAESKGIELKLEYDENASKNITSDPNRLRQIIINLVGNAMKFTIKGEIKIVVEEPQHKRFLIKVVDTGIGIKKANLKKLFKAFGKVENIQEQELNPQGVGLGLVISNQLAKLLCSDSLYSGLNVTSTPNIGSTFFLFVDDLVLEKEPSDANDDSICSLSGKVLNLPKFSSITHLISPTSNIYSNHIELSLQQNFFTSTLAESTYKEFPTKEIIETYKEQTILIVDDHVFNQIALKELLKPFGFKFDVASNGLQAIEKVKLNPHQYTMVFLDLEMPIMGGIECCIELKRLINEGEVSKFAIIGQSGHGEDDKKKSLDNGMDDYLQKPLNSADIIKLVSKWVPKQT